MAALIPHYNDIAGLKLALASLADESAAVIVVDDGSATAPKKKELLQAHPYLNGLQIIYLAENIGKVQALNVGLSYASDYDYIARLDCGDQSLAGRIATQKAFLDSHPQCHRVGSWAGLGWAGHIEADSGKRHIQRYPSDHQDILAVMYRRNTFCHSATMYRRETALALGGYPTKYKSAEDYALFFAMAKKYQAANIPKVLTCLHTTPNDNSVSHRMTQALSSIRIVASHIDSGHVIPAASGIATAGARLLFGNSVTGTPTAR